ncbi:DUF418 domain-containing protein [Nocardiopsis lambiniae]|uniref:DUF418 domain-containing protein n=1 Tax=Nocardiopsis lambiniae TaxID=3075539 RepID=A0ABU2M4A8_9ACTN|nr:DUF418 domain-containing protein [Nocardiopsis sp. DSM 44743]MDT0327146.1 DUF418 domain-containing protein [Nocardiopsis sp. DSM 44743]
MTSPPDGTGVPEPSAAPSAPAAEPPVTPSRRLPLLDVLRGVAILGTLATNVWLFTAPGGEANMLFGEELSPLAAALADPSPGTVTQGVLLLFSNGKFLALLTLLFGVGLAIQYRSAERRGERWPGPYTWRALFLFVEGLVHFTLVFAADVLMGYAVTALVVAWLLTRSPRVRNAVMWCSAALHLAVIGLLTVALAYLPQPGAQSADGGVPTEVVDLYAHGTYLEQIAFRFDNALAMRSEPIITFAFMVCMFLLGVRLFRADAFEAGETGRRLRDRLLVWGLGVGVPLNLATALAGPEWFFVERYVAAPVVALGLVGAIGWLVDRADPAGWGIVSLSSLGRVAMTGYVAQNLICVLACYGIGLGLAARFADTGPWWVMGLWAAVSALLLIGSTLWLRRFRLGPLEALQKAVLGRIPARRR